jgi:hypothetical protein
MVMIRGMKHEVIDRRLILKVFRGEFIPCVKLLKELQYRIVLYSWQLQTARAKYSEEQGGRLNPSMEI